MAEYVNAQALLADVRLRLDGLGQASAALVVEGPDDKRIFYHRLAAVADVVPSGGKRLLRAGLAAMQRGDEGRILFLTDCDYDVLKDSLHGGPNIVITKACDVEADLIELGVLEKVVVEVVADAILTKKSAAMVASNVRSRAEEIAAVIGRIRIVAQPLGVDLDFDNWDLAKFWDASTSRPLVPKIYQTVLARLKRAGVSITPAEWKALMDGAPNESWVCNGKDLVAAVQMVLRKHYKMDHRISKDTIVGMMRLSVDDAQFESWSVVARIHQWEKRSGRVLLAAA